ncbi:hypothetical protein DFH08DRAFT_941992 [Mycena albidolilacea]|uniref:Uncharacterized protein n=1 Tax=Mycena albidolilacea TaxID=1033008 RepID=A0AAD6ZFX2_9AGAR|nr:hypothetical protein DFH08DRAFT_941992 [Mycena albidolilacea]
MELSVFLFFFGTIWTTARAGDPDVFPSEFLVPQCTVLKAVWGQPPPIHLHVQPGSDITVHNLVDLGLQSGTSTDFTVALPIGQNFTFAYNTIANQFLVFVSSLMQVGPGTTECLPGSEDTTTPPPPPPQTTSSTKAPPTTSPTKAPPTTSTTDAPPTTTSKSSPTTADSTSSVSNPSSAPSAPSSQAADFAPSTSASQGIVPVATASVGSPKAAAAFPVGPVVGSVCALAVVILIALAIFLWYWNRRSKRMLAHLNPEPERNPRAPTMTGTMSTRSEMSQQVPLLLPMRGHITPYQESFAPQDHPSLRLSHSASNSVSGSTEPSTTTTQEREHEQRAPATSAMTMHSELAQQVPVPVPMRGDITPYQESFAPLEHPKMRDFHGASNSVSGPTEPSTTTTAAQSETRGRRGYLSVSATAADIPTHPTCSTTCAGHFEAPPHVFGPLCLPSPSDGTPVPEENVLASTDSTTALYSTAVAAEPVPREHGLTVDASGISSLLSEPASLTSDVDFGQTHRDNDGKQGSWTPVNNKNRGDYGFDETSGKHTCCFYSRFTSDLHSGAAEDPSLAPIGTMGEVPSKPKGKGADPRIWGNISFGDFTEADFNAQREVLANFAEINHTQPASVQFVPESTAEEPDSIASETNPTKGEGIVPGQTRDEQIAELKRQLGDVKQKEHTERGSKKSIKIEPRKLLTIILRV